MGQSLEQAAEAHKATITDYIGMNEDCMQSFIKGANWQAERMFTEDQMFMFAGYCMGKKTLDPFKDVSEIMNEWKEECKDIQL